ncbi:MAG: polysaccharide biosynthesis protein, partial [Odoribacter sp.]
MNEQTYQVSSKRITKNMIFLYIRMLFTMGVALYTSRIILNALGEEDFGIYNVVGGVVSMLAFVNGMMSSGTSRFLTYELGSGDFEQLRKIFSVALVLHIGIALSVFLLAETLGLWFVMTQMTIPADRMNAAFWVYQFSVLVCVVQLIQTPYNASIIAHERMNIYAYISILEVVFKLGVAGLVACYVTVDRLIFYAASIFIVFLIIALVYRVYCQKMYAECHFRFVKDKVLYKTLLHFSGWDMLGSLCVVSQGQGLNILLNIFFGPIVNAARGIAFQVEAAFNAFVGNFMLAVQPQIVKLYAANELRAMIGLVNASSKYSFYLVWILALPVLFKTEYILTLWLKEIPEYTVIFLRLILINCLIRAMARSVVIAVHASGDIRELNLWGGSIGLLPLPLSYVLLRSGYEPEIAFIVVIVCSIFCNIVELIVLKRRITFSLNDYLLKVYF